LNYKIQRLLWAWILTFVLIFSIIILPIIVGIIAKEENTMEETGSKVEVIFCPPTYEPTPEVTEQYYPHFELD